MDFKFRCEQTIMYVLCFCVISLVDIPRFKLLLLKMPTTRQVHVKMVIHQIIQFLNFMCTSFVIKAMFFLDVIFYSDNIFLIVLFCSSLQVERLTFFEQKKIPAQTSLFVSYKVVSLQSPNPYGLRERPKPDGTTPIEEDEEGGREGRERRKGRFREVGQQ
ncbi:uncharacterized protein LOC130723576 [Lotus japonicus]|uniref:uncharacterized protein LOC130723576 n=1 Tax=Lotus japonicus TaxID=34305 RepID=UPI00258D5AAF|nr:uncharacterized protein LOC130723576 [Lotus japonicus]